MGTMKTGALVLSFNHCELTQRCVQSVQKFFLDEKIILVHNGSESRVVEKLKNRFPGIHHLVMTNNLGYAGGMNKGLEHFYVTLNLPWCLAITNDAELMAMNFLVEELDARIIAPLIYFRSMKKIDAWGAWYEIKKGKLHHHRDMDKLVGEFDHSTFYIPGTAFLVHREVLAKKHYFMGPLFTFWEDVLWSHQAKHLGFKLSRTNLITFKHGGGKTTRKDTTYTSYFYQRNRIIVTKLIEKNIMIRILALTLIIQSLIFQIAKKIIKGDWIRGKHLVLALFHGIKFKIDE